MQVLKVARLPRRHKKQRRPRRHVFADIYAGTESEPEVLKVSRLPPQNAATERNDFW